jgi:hypothetical protein
MSVSKPFWTLRDVSFLLHVVPEIIEDTNEVAIRIGGHKLAQLPRFVVGLGNDLRLRGHRRPAAGCYPFVGQVPEG